MRKKKKQGSISDIWKKIEESLESYNSQKISEKEFDKVLEAVFASANKSGISDIIAQNLILPHMQDLSDVKVRFTKFTEDEPSGILPQNNWMDVYINPLEVYKFRQRIVAYTSCGQPEPSDFESERTFYFYKELLKLPPPYFLFIAALSKIAMTKEVFTAEKRGGKKNVPGKLTIESYFPLLWALKQFEAFYKRIQNRDMRSDFGIIWHEGEWIEKNKKQEKKK